MERIDGRTGELETLFGRVQATTSTHRAISLENAPPPHGAFVYVFDAARNRTNF